MLEGSYFLGLSDLMDQNLTCYEYVNGLPPEIRQKLEQRDFGSLDEIQTYVAMLKKRGVMLNGVNMTGI